MSTLSDAELATRIGEACALMVRGAGPQVSHVTPRILLPILEEIASQLDRHSALQALEEAQHMFQRTGTLEEGELVGDAKLSERTGLDVGADEDELSPPNEGSKGR